MERERKRERERGRGRGRGGEGKRRITTVGGKATEEIARESENGDNMG